MSGKRDKSEGFGFMFPEATFKTKPNKDTIEIDDLVEDIQQVCKNAIQLIEEGHNSEYVLDELLRELESWKK